MVYLPKGSIMQWNGTKVTEHNRSELNVDVERIGDSQRTMNGTMRKWYVADKKTFSCSWDNLPALTTKTVDGSMGGVAIEAFYMSNTGPFTLTINNTHGVETYTVVFTKFSKNIVKRVGTADLWNIDITLEEV